MREERRRSNCEARTAGSDARRLAGRRWVITDTLCRLLDACMGQPSQSSDRSRNAPRSMIATHVLVSIDQIKRPRSALLRIKVLLVAPSRHLSHDLTE